MVIIKVVAMFDDRLELENAREELIRSGLASADSIRVEPEIAEETAEAEISPTGWERLEAIFDTEADHDVSTYAEGIRRGSALLVVETPTEKAEKVKDVLRRNGAIDLRRRVNRWITTGWDTFDPSAPRFTELEILDERKATLSEAEIAADAGLPDGPERTVTILGQTSGQQIGRITEAELAVMRSALEDDRPGDNDYWINSAVTEEIAGLPGATPHLIALLRRAVDGNPEGVDIRIEGEGGAKSVDGAAA